MHATPEQTETQTDVAEKSTAPCHILGWQEYCNYCNRAQICILHYNELKIVEMDHVPHTSP